MSLKDLVVFLETGQGVGERLEYAAALASRWHSHLIATFVTQPLALIPHASFAVGDGLADMIAEYRVRTDAALEAARLQFQRRADPCSFTGEWRQSDNQTAEALMLHARHASLAVLGPPAAQGHATTMLGLSERVIFSSGRPCLLVPERWHGEPVPQRIVVGWNGGREATRAIADAVPFLTAAEAVHLIVVPDARTRTLFGEDPGADMAAHLARQGARVVLEQCPGDDAGAVLLDRCASVGAEMLVVGAIGRPRISELLLGGATRTLLARAKLPLLVSN